MTIELLLILSVVSSLAFFCLVRVVMLEFQVSKLSRLIEYLMARGHDGY